MSDAIVSVQGIRKTYGTPGRRTTAGKRPAVDDVSLEIRHGELLVLLGPSGCGKTTLLRSIAGLEKPDQGRVSVAGRTLFSSEEGVDVAPESRRIGMMFQSYALWPHLTVYENVRFPLTRDPAIPKDRHRDLVTEALERLGVGDYGDRHPGQLSGGEQQRVALARALVASPSVILFDEPLSNVDAKVRKGLRRHIRELKEEKGFAGVYVTHDQEEAMELADTLAVMEAGRIRQIGTPREIYEDPQSIGVATFVGEVNRLDGTVTAAHGGRLSVETALGVIEVDGSASPGDSGTVVVRPEDVIVSSASTALTGVVRSVVFLGARIEYVIDAAGTSLVVSTSDKDSAPAVGSTVSLRLREGASRWLTR